MSSLPVLESHANRIFLLMDILESQLAKRRNKMNIRVLQGITRHPGPFRETILCPEPCLYCGTYMEPSERIHDHCSDWECRRQCGECAQERAEYRMDDMGKDEAHKEIANEQR